MHAQNSHPQTQQCKWTGEAPRQCIPDCNDDECNQGNQPCGTGIGLIRAAPGHFVFADQHVIPPTSGVSKLAGSRPATKRGLSSKPTFCSPPKSRVKVCADVPAACTSILTSSSA